VCDLLKYPESCPCDLSKAEEMAQDLEEEDESRGVNRQIVFETDLLSLLDIQNPIRQLRRCPLLFGEMFESIR
jgi:hypothetical protein